MRKLATFQHADQALLFNSYLNMVGIEAQLDDPDPEITLWVVNEDDFTRAQQELAQYESNPNDQKYQNIPPAPRKVIDQPAATRNRYVNVRSEIFNRRRSQSNKVTITLILLSIFATLVLDGSGFNWLKIKLYYSQYMGTSFYEIRQGEIWRLITPIFMHGGFFHLIFNMMWLWDLGGQIEQREGSLVLALQVLFFAIIVNTAQYLVSGPNFIGMSGVVYALLSYVWMMTKYSSRHNYFLANGIVLFMVGWMVICILGIIPNTANTQHVVGFLIGALVGYLRSGDLLFKWKRYRRRK